MLTSRVAVGVPKLFKRNFGIVCPALQKATDPIQQLFLDKLREYKSKTAGGKSIDDPEIVKERQAELEKIAKQYGGGSGTDMTQFPQFKFTDPKVDAGVSSSN
ncbi:ATP synthase-coupling factor 6, mitochondrial [Cephus cinctus]|uniref:ATP synthase-coupling factor 6, mitochondrial n=1 Tax=Cephus cinctus TaxID=211228 RepID=A0AAJ7BIM4_CEPCN|nr:ATP synthase-coupling factor 6, mitochondrial [Cephus cinctus]